MKSLIKPIIIFAALIATIGAAFWFSANGFTPIDTNDPIFIPVLIASALVDSVNPCAFSVLLITVAFLASLGMERKKVLLLGASYISGILVVYVLIGLGMLRVLDIFGVPHFVTNFGAGILLFFGSSQILSYFYPHFPIEFKIPEFIKGRLAKLIKEASLLATFFLGVLVALFEFPCTGGPYLMILGLLHDSQTYGSGLLYLLLYNLIFIAPLVAILLLASDKTLFARAEEWKKKAAGRGKLFSGLAMILLALVIFWVN